MKRLFTVYFLIITSFTFYQAAAQDEGFMYGEVTTIDGDTYKGALRWGKEEAFWNNMFNAAKEENENLDFLTRDERKDLEDRRRDGWSGNNWIKVNWSGKGGDNYDFIHQFSCQFGEIKTILPSRREGADVILQNGMSIEVDGSGYNDIGTKVQVNDPELGTIELAWSRIEKIEFMATPSNLSDRFGAPLYGTVESDAGAFTGFIQWDHDERVSEDKLDGDTDDGDVSLKFGSIASIERYGSSRSIVVLNSGRELTLRGSNDVNDDNRGIIVTVEGLGQVDIQWDEFEKVTFKKAPNSGPGYRTYASQEKLEGTVKTKSGETLSGTVIFDLDESYNFEVLQGKSDDVEFVIPFRNIREVTPKNYEYSHVTLTNGEKYLLGDSQDVSDKNQGVIVMRGNDPTYIAYEDIEKITF